MVRKAHGARSERQRLRLRLRNGASSASSASPALALSSGVALLGSRLLLLEDDELHAAVTRAPLWRLVWRDRALLPIPARNEPARIDAVRGQPVAHGVRALIGEHL